MSTEQPASAAPAAPEQPTSAEVTPQDNRKNNKKDKLLVTTSPAITTTTVPAAVPEGYSYFSEGSANILYQDKNAVFYNPVQEFNRDMSIMMIKLFQDMREAEGTIKSNIIMIFLFGRLS